MRYRNIAIGILVSLCILAAAQNLWYWTQLPDRVATHFGVDGQPNGWMPKSTATLFMLALQIGLPLMLVGVAKIVEKLPTSVINLPNREYYLSPERRPATVAYLQSFMAWMAVIVSLFMIFMNHLAYLANHKQTRFDSSAAFVGLGIYATLVAVMIGWILVRFKRPAQIV